MPGGTGGSKDRPKEAPQAACAGMTAELRRRGWSCCARPGAGRYRKATVGLGRASQDYPCLTIMSHPQRVGCAHRRVCGGRQRAAARSWWGGGQMCRGPLTPAGASCVARSWGAADVPRSTYSRWRFVRGSFWTGNRQLVTNTRVGGPQFRGRVRGRGRSRGLRGRPAQTSNSVRGIPDCRIMDWSVPMRNSA